MHFNIWLSCCISVCTIFIYSFLCKWMIFSRGWCYQFLTMRGEMEIFYCIIVSYWLSFLKKVITKTMELKYISIVWMLTMLSNELRKMLSISWIILFDVLKYHILIQYVWKLTIFPHFLIFILYFMLLLANIFVARKKYPSNKNHWIFSEFTFYFFLKWWASILKYKTKMLLSLSALSYSLVIWY